MIEVYEHLFVGDANDYERSVKRQQGWRVVHACREPYHREALGYTGRAAPKTHPEYLIARRGHRLILNLIDADDPAYIPKEIIDAALAFIGESLGLGQRVLVHCNQGYSRAPAIGMLHLASRTNRFLGMDYPKARALFREVYPHFNPAPGISGFLLTHWKLYCLGHERKELSDCSEGMRT